MKEVDGNEAGGDKKGGGMWVLLIEDDEEMRDFVCSALKESGHTVDCEETMKGGLASAQDKAFDVMFVDRMLPDGDGLEMVRKLRGFGVKTPVLFMTALGDVDDRVEGLRAGGDDYLVKPFEYVELLARAEALTRRSGGELETRLKVADLELDVLSRECRRGGELIRLQPREYKLLEYLMRREGSTVTRAMLLEGVWGYQFYPQTNVIDVHVSRLRAKVDRGHEVQLLKTVWGQGYILGALD